MDSERNFAYLGAVDLKKFTLSENKKHIQNATTFEHRNFTQRSLFTQIDFTYPCSSETLIAVNILTYSTSSSSLRISLYMKACLKVCKLRPAL